MLLLVACKGEDFNFPVTPELKLNGVQQYQLNGKDSAIVIDISYTDGDGDIGLEVSDTFPPFTFKTEYFYNLHVYPFEVVNGVSKPLIIPSSTDTINFNDRIHTLTPTGKNKAIFGSLKVTLKAQPYFSLTPDSMFYRVYIYDRQLHKSNVIETPVLKFIF
ncbi:MAG: hypothetical protein IT245_09335 [Bacteroidia bacterium]|nr:hypothetical protein [Bacteroidia bacterium]